jgi:hypothetical protein
LKLGTKTKPASGREPIIIVEVTFALILIVVIIAKSSDEDELIYEEALDLLIELMRKIKEEKSEVIDSAENIRKPTAVNSKT